MFIYLRLKRRLEQIINQDKRPNRIYDESAAHQHERELVLNKMNGRMEIYPYI